MKRIPAKIEPLCPLCGKPRRLKRGMWRYTSKGAAAQCWHWHGSPLFQRAVRRKRYKRDNPTKRGDKRGQTKPMRRS